MGKNIENNIQAINIISQGTKIEGNISSNGDFRIDGELIGDFNSNLKLVIGASGKVIGNISCNECDISGKVEGNIETLDILVLKATASVRGDLKIKKICIEPDAEFSGHCKMSDHKPEIQIEEV